MEALIPKILSEKDKKKQSFLIHEYYFLNHNMVTLLSEMAKYYDEDIILSHEKDGEINISWKNNFIILKKG